MPALELTERFRRTVIRVNGDAGAEWLAHLPRQLEIFSERWGLTLGPPFDLSYNFVVPAVPSSASGTTDDVVLKCGVPSAELRSEIEALRVFDGRGSARLLDADDTAGVLLIERLLPGVTLDRAVSDDETAAVVAANVMRQLWRPAPTSHNFPAVADWVHGFSRHRARFNGATGPLPVAIFEQAETMARELLASAPELLLLHGDLHHGNILTDGQGTFRSIDPKGIIGDPAFEPGAFLLNPHPVSAGVMERRIAVFAERLDLERERIRAWGLVRAVLSACWTIEDNGDDYASAIDGAEQLGHLA